MNQLITYGEASPGYLGVVTGELLDRTSSETFFGRPDINGLLIEQVNPDSPAEKANIQPGDVMQAIDGVAITNIISAVDQINRKAPGEMVDLTIYRTGESIKIAVQLGEGTAQYRIPY